MFVPLSIVICSFVKGIMDIIFTGKEFEHLSVHTDVAGHLSLHTDVAGHLSVHVDVAGRIYGAVHQSVTDFKSCILFRKFKTTF